MYNATKNLKNIGLYIFFTKKINFTKDSNIPLKKTLQKKMPLKNIPICLQRNLKNISLKNNLKLLF